MIGYYHNTEQKSKLSPLQMVIDLQQITSGPEISITEQSKAWKAKNGLVAC